MRDPAVSVILPVYNGEKHLAAALNSILSQTVNDFELLVINDGSVDRSSELIQKYSDCRIRLIEQSNHGLAATLNRGISLARGKFIARQDQDDISLPRRLEKQIAHLELHPRCGLVGTWAQIWSGEKRTRRVHRHATENHQLQYDLTFDNPFVHSSVMLRKEAVVQAGGYCTDPARQPPEDYELWSRIARSWEVGNIPDILHIYREVPTSMSRKGHRPFLKQLVMITTENICYRANRHPSDRSCRLMAEMVHGVAMKEAPDIADIRNCLDDIVTGLVGSNVAQRRELTHRAQMTYSHLRTSIPATLPGRLAARAAFILSRFL